MCRQKLILKILLLLTTFLLSVYSHADEQKPPVVVELFTSQGCYSCPPADEFLGELAHEPELITFACHVTYWNYLGWKDTFSQQFCDQRQRAYQSVLLGGRRGVYTPQMVVNGRYGGVGSRQGDIRYLINADRHNNTPVQAMGLKIEGQQLTLKLAPELHKGEQQLILLGTTGVHLLPINRGENAGKRLTYINPAEYIQPLGQWDGKATMSVDLPERPDVKHWVVLLQQWPLGEIIAAGKIGVYQSAMRF